MNRIDTKNRGKVSFVRHKWHKKLVYQVCVWWMDGTEDFFYIDSPDQLEDLKHEIRLSSELEEIEAIICDDEPVEHEFFGLDFSDPELAEDIFRFIGETKRLGDVRRKRISMLEYVTLVCPNEFFGWLIAEAGAPDSGAGDQFNRS